MSIIKERVLAVAETRKWKFTDQEKQDLARLDGEYLSITDHPESPVQEVLQAQDSVATLVRVFIQAMEKAR